MIYFESLNHYGVTVMKTVENKSNILRVLAVTIMATFALLSLSTLWEYKYFDGGISIQERKMLNASMAHNFKCFVLPVSIGGPAVCFLVGFKLD